MTPLKVQILNLSCIVFNDVVSAYFPSGQPHASCSINIPSSFPSWVLVHIVPSALDILLFLFFWMDALKSELKHHLVDECLLQYLSHVLPRQSKKLPSLCAHNTWCIYLLLHLSYFIVVKCAFGFLPHYTTNPLEAEMVFIPLPLGFLGLSLWAPLLQNMKHNPLVETQHDNHII